MHTDSISVTLDEAVTRLEEIVDLHAPRVEGCGRWELERRFLSLTDGSYGTHYRAVAYIPESWAGSESGVFWLEATSEDPVDALDKLANLIIAKAPVAA